MAKLLVYFDAGRFFVFVAGRLSDGNIAVNRLDMAKIDEEMYSDYVYFQGVSERTYCISIFWEASDVF